MDSLQCVQCRRTTTEHHELRQGRRRAFVCRYLVSRLYTLTLSLLASVFGRMCHTSPINYDRIRILVVRVVVSKIAVLLLWQDDYGNTPRADQGMIGHPECTPWKHIHLTSQGVVEYLIKARSKLLINPCILNYSYIIEVLPVMNGWYSVILLLLINDPSPVPGTRAQTNAHTPPHPTFHTLRLVVYIVQQRLL
jgi:hypothetical protein